MSKLSLRGTQLNRDRASAKRLREDIQLHMNDMQWLSEGNHTIVYAVDNDITMLHFNTELVALSANAREGYTQIFSGDDTANAISLGVILSHHIFYTLGKNAEDNGVRLLIPPLDREFATILYSVLNHSAREIATAQAKVADADKLLNDSDITDSAMARHLMERAPEILTALFGNNSYSAQSKRLCALVNDNRLASLIDFDNGLTCGLPPQFIEVCREKKSLFDMVWSSILKDEWFARLARPSHNEKRRENLSGDAEALATLQLINKRLDGHGIRFILITGARNLLETGHGITIGDGSESRSFSDLWLRHPRCFLGGPAIFGSATGSAGDDGGNNLIAILDAFLAGDISRDDHHSPNAVGSKNALEAFGTFQRAWNTFSSNLCLKHAGILEREKSDEQSITDLIRNIRRAEGGLTQLLEESWQSVFLAAVQTGFLYSWSLARELRRNLPELVFESFNDATQFVHDMLDQHPGTEIDDFSQRIAKVKNDLSGGYTTHLVFGVLFAAQNNWRIAESLADNAIRLVFSDAKTALESVRADEKRIVTGREAFYLKAIAKRHLAKSASQLTAAHDAINLAIQMLNLEREVRGNDLLQDDIRFEYELCSINVAGAMFEKFLGESPVFFERLKVDQLLSKLAHLYQTRSIDCHEHACKDGCRECCRILTSLFIVELALNCNIGDAFPERLNQYLTHFRKIISNASKNNNPTLHPTRLTMTIFSIADWWGEFDASIKENKKANALREIDHSIAHMQEGIAPYENERYVYLRNFVC